MSCRSQSIGSRQAALGAYGGSVPVGAAVVPGYMSARVGSGVSETGGGNRELSNPSSCA